MYSTVLELQLYGSLLFFIEKLVDDWHDLFCYFQKNFMAITAGEKENSDKMLRLIESSFGHLRVMEYKKK